MFVAVIVVAAVVAAVTAVCCLLFVVGCWLLVGWLPVVDCSMFGCWLVGWPYD